jgi:hypothetical protein
MCSEYMLTAHIQRQFLLQIYTKRLVAQVYLRSMTMTCMRFFEKNSENAYGTSFSRKIVESKN